MSNQTPREQIEDQLIKLRAEGWSRGKEQKDTPYDYTLSDQAPVGEALDAILAVFTGLPAMQEVPPPEPMSLDQATVCIWKAERALRRQILAELNGSPEAIPSNNGLEGQGGADAK